MILADTSVWVEHLRHGNRDFAKLLANDEILMHPFVAGELACGSLKNRAAFLDFINALSGTKIATHTEAFHLLDNNQLWGRGIG